MPLEASIYSSSLWFEALEVGLAKALLCLLSRRILWIFFSCLPGNVALKNGGDFWWIFSGLRLPRNEARKVLEKFGKNSEQNSGQNSGRKFEKFGKLSFCNFSDLTKLARSRSKQTRDKGSVSHVELPLIYYRLQQTRVYPYPLGAGSARPNPKMGAPDLENPSFVGFSALRGGLRPWSQTMVSEGPRPWGRGRSGDYDSCMGVSQLHW